MRSDSIAWFCFFMFFHIHHLVQQSILYSHYLAHKHIHDHFELNRFYFTHFMSIYTHHIFLSHGVCTNHTQFRIDTHKSVGDNLVPDDAFHWKSIENRWNPRCQDQFYQPIRQIQYCQEWTVRYQASSTDYLAAIIAAGRYSTENRGYYNEIRLIEWYVGRRLGWIIGRLKRWFVWWRCSSTGAWRWFGRRFKWYGRIGCGSIVGLRLRKHFVVVLAIVRTNSIVIVRIGQRWSTTTSTSRWW